ncbi:uncharacterized protein LOC125488650 [Plutella xylostella]|uniref:uncharacterized protein LOC125488650 n=1 Tax=Plutella xylostella TaxID=51655 RepID=UPI00203292EC|nr:uncharacterized protein LOC125488650 [Plutella xylostella]
MKRRSARKEDNRVSAVETASTSTSTETNSNEVRMATEEEEDDSPPAKKLLKDLLVHEVDKALRSLQEETPKLCQSNLRAASLIPEFDPENEDCTITTWLKKIEQLGEIHGWDDKTKSFHLQDKLRGQARRWYNRLESYDYTWDDWKVMLIRAFPKHRDYGNMLENMLNRRKLPSETMTKYYQEKIAMCFRCNLSDAATLSCIIRGLPVQLQSNARAYQCTRPDQLYEGFLSALDDYRYPTFESRAFNKQPLERKPSAANTESDPCPRCKKTGHLVRYCPLPDLRSCFKCGAQGHIAPRCPVTKDAPINSSNTVKNIQLVQNYSDIYMKSVKVDGTYVKAYLDTGSQVNVMSTEVARLLSLPIKPTQIILKGFSGGMLTTRGEVTFKLEVDKLNIPCQAYLTDINMNNIHLLIGQPIINHEGVTLLVHNNTAVLQQDCDFLSQIEVTEERQKFNVVTHSKETLPPGSSIIMVDIEGNNQDADVITPARHFEMDGTSYSIPATILRGCQGHLKVFNSGTKDILWEPGVVLVRAEICKHTPLRHQDGRM